MANLARTGPKHSDQKRRIGHPLRLTALLALREALVQERYEECREIIVIAKEFGARDSQIYYLLEDPRRNP